MIGIYQIKNKINNKIYIGQSVNIHKRWKQHIYELNNNSHYNTHLCNSWKKYGEDNFLFSVVCECLFAELDEKEKYYIDKNKSYDFDFGYNMTLGGEGAKRYYDTDLILSTYNSVKSVVKTSEILGINEYKISEILDQIGRRQIKNPCRRIVALDPKNYSIKYEFDSIKDAYQYFSTPVANQINKSIKDSNYLAFDCIWFDREDYIKHNNMNELLNIKKYKDTTQYDNSKMNDYTHKNRTKVICVTTNLIFDSIVEAASFYNIKNSNGICYCCSYKRSKCGGLSWMYLDEYQYMTKNNLTYIEMKNKYIDKNVTKRVVCLNNLKIFTSIVEANKYAGLSVYSGKISGSCKKNKYASVGKDKNSNPLVWAYYEDYIVLNKSDIHSILSQAIQNYKNKFVCLNTKQIFCNIESAMTYANLKSRANIYSVCDGKRNYAGRHPLTGEPLKWKYYKDFIKE